jgi:hypothetical protein
MPIPSTLFAVYPAATCTRAAVWLHKVVPVVAIFQYILRPLSSVPPFIPLSLIPHPLPLCPLFLPSLPLWKPPMAISGRLVTRLGPANCLRCHQVVFFCFVSVDHEIDRG